MLPIMNFLSKFLMFAVGLCCCSCIAGNTTVTDRDILALLKSQMTDTDYLNILSHADNYDIEIIERKKKCTVYKFSSFDLGANEHDFIFCLNSDLDRVFLLTGSLSNYNQYVLPEHNPLTKEKVKMVAKESSLFTREFYKQFVLLDSMDKAIEWLTEAGISTLSEKDYQLVCIVDSKGNRCQVPVLIEQDLFMRDFTIESDKVSFSDQLVKKEVGKFFSPH